MDKKLPYIGTKYKWGAPKLSHLGTFIVTGVNGNLQIPGDPFAGEPQISYTYENGYATSMPASFWFSDEAQPVQVN